jgi:protein-disulfide isomerase
MAINVGRIKAAIDGLASVAVILVAACVLWVTVPRMIKSPREVPVPTLPASLSGAATMGAADARAALIVYSDVECPFCRTFATETLPTIRRDYVDTGRLLIAFRHFPLERIHPHAFRAAAAMECARRQNQFWPLHDGLFKGPKELDDSQVRSRAEKVGLSLPELDRCLEGSATEAVKADLRAARNLGLRSTPSLLLGNLVPDGVKVAKVISGAMRLPDLRRELDDLLRKPTFARSPK